MEDQVGEVGLEEEEAPILDSKWEEEVVDLVMLVELELQMV
jgi:hypothetical protein